MPLKSSHEIKLVVVLEVVTKSDASTHSLSPLERRKVVARLPVEPLPFKEAAEI